MKKFMMVIGVFLIVLVLLAVVAIRFLDLERFKEGMVRQASQATGRAVEIDSISLGFRPDLVLRLGGLRVFSDETRRIPFISVPRFDAKIDWGALFQRKLVVGYAVFESPEIRVSRESFASGAPVPRKEPAPGIEDKTPSAGGASAADKKAPMGAAALVTRRFIVNDGAVLFEEAPGEGARGIGVRKIDLEVRDLAWNEKASFSVRAAVLESPNQNLRLSGHLGPLVAGDILSTVQARMSLDFGSIDFDRLKKAAPFLQDLALSGQAIRGDFEGEVSRFDVAVDGKLRGLDAKGELDISEMRFNSMGRPFRDLKSEFEISGREARIRESQVNLGEGAVTFAFESRDIFEQRGHHLTAEMRQMELHDFFPTARSSDAIELHGTMRADLDLAFDGIQSTDIRRSLKGWGAFALEDGVINNFNILARVIDKVSGIPLVGGSLAQRIAEKYRPFLEEDNMKIRVANGRFALGEGQAQISEMYLESDFFQAVASGVVSLEGQAHLPGQLYLNPEFSQALISSLNDLASLADPYGRIILPFTVVGTFPHLKVQMDTEHIVSRLVQSRAEKLIDRFLDKKEGSSEESSGGDIVDQILEGLVR